MKVKYDEAISMAQKAVIVKPDADNICDTLGWLYYEKGDIKKAIDAMEEANKLNPDDEYYSKNLEKFRSELN